MRFSYVETELKVEEELTRQPLDHNISKLKRKRHVENPNLTKRIFSRTKWMSISMCLVCLGCIRLENM
jgi:hypothetical protein